MIISTFSYREKQFARNRKQVVDETLFRLVVNGRDLVSLVASPHLPEELILGYLFLQGMIASLDDIETLGICSDSGQVVIQIRGEVPVKLHPTLTSGCGGGIVLNGLASGSRPPSTDAQAVYAPETIIAVMSGLVEASEKYSEHGGIHSAALCDERGVLLHAEDLGRHNAIDRIAGQALQGKVATVGRILVTSGRISSEMVVKAVRLGVSALATRTSPTSLAVKLCEEHSIGLAGYVRGQRLEIYANKERFGA